MLSTLKSPGMKDLILKLSPLFFLVLIITSCKKETKRDNGGDSIHGVWELRKIKGGWSNNTYQPGNGNSISFIGNKYEIKQNGQVTQSGEFILVTDFTVSEATCLNIAAGQYTDRIIFDNTNNTTKVFFELSDNELILLSGCFAYDAGSYRHYERQ